VESREYENVAHRFGQTYFYKNKYSGKSEEITGVRGLAMKREDRKEMKRLLKSAINTEADGVAAKSIEWDDERCCYKVEIQSATINKISIR